MCARRTRYADTESIRLVNHEKTGGAQALFNLVPPLNSKMKQMEPKR